MTTKSKQHELRDKFRSLPRTDRLDPRYPIDAYEDDLVTLINSEVLAVLEELEKAYYEPVKDKGYLDLGHVIQTLKEKYKS